VTFNFAVSLTDKKLRHRLEKRASALCSRFITMLLSGIRVFLSLGTYITGVGFLANLYMATGACESTSL